MSVLPATPPIRGGVCSSAPLGPRPGGQSRPPLPLPPRLALLANRGGLPRRLLAGIDGIDILIEGRLYGGGAEKCTAAVGRFCALWFHVNLNVLRNVTFDLPIYIECPGRKQWGSFRRAAGALGLRFSEGRYTFVGRTSSTGR